MFVRRRTATACCALAIFGVSCEAFVSLNPSHPTIGHWQPETRTASPREQAVSIRSSTCAPLEENLLNHVQSAIEPDEDYNYGACYLVNKCKPMEDSSCSVLGVKGTARWTEVKSAYRRLAKQYHPDSAAQGGGAANLQKFREINQAYKALKHHAEKFGDYTGPATTTSPDVRAMQGPMGVARRSSGLQKKHMVLGNGKIISID